MDMLSLAYLCIAVIAGSNVFIAAMTVVWFLTRSRDRDS